jgi:hypothetical protein
MQREVKPGDGRISAALIVALGGGLLLGLLQPSFAQPPKGEEDPFGAKKGPMPMASEAAPEPERRNEPALIQVIRESNPTTPVELVTAARQVLDYGRADEAKRYLTKLLEAKADDAALAAVVRQLGADVVVRLQHAPDAQPEGAQAARLILDAAHRYATDAARLAEVTRQLSVDSAATRVAAIKDLAHAGPAAVPPLLDVLKNEVRKAEHPQVIAALVKLRGDTEGPLVAALSTKDDALQGLVIVALGEMRSRQALPLLIRPAFDAKAPATLRATAQEALQRTLGAMPSREESVAYLRKRVKDLLAGQWLTKPDYEGNVSLWQWDARISLPVLVKQLPDDAAVSLAARIADDLAALAEENAAIERLRWRARLDAAQREAGLANPLPAELVEEAKAGGLQAINEVLDQALEAREIPAAIAAARLLGELGDDRLLVPTTSEGSPLTRALRFSDRRVRFAAIEAIGRIDPTESYLGAGWLVEGLGNSIATQGMRRILVAAVNEREGQALVGLMAQLGFEADMFRVGWRAFEAAAHNADYEAVLIADTIDHPAAGELVQWLRRDYRTAALPIGLIAWGERLDRTAFRWEHEPRMVVMPMLYDADSAAFYLQRLLATMGRHQTTGDERLEQAAVSLSIVARMLANVNKYPFYDVRRLEPVCLNALTAPRLAEPAAQALAGLGSHPAQRALVDFASRRQYQLVDRQAAAAAFEVAVKDFGLNLTTTDIARQFDRFEQAADQPEESRQILGQTLDVIRSRLVPAVQPISTRYVEVLTP